MQTTTILNDKQSLKTHYVVPSLTTTATEKPPGGVETVPVATPPDARKQLYNGGNVGPIGHVQVSTEHIVKLRGILFDIDPTNLREGSLLPGLSHEPERFYEDCVRRWLANNALLDHAKVRVSGTGLHAILWLDPPVEFADDAERTRWCSIVKVAQAALPTDPLAPGITATTRPVGSTNTKSNLQVRLLKQGSKISPSDVIELQQQMCAAPFVTLFRILTGSKRVSPCPFCNKETLVALDHVGTCYGCGKVKLERLCEELFLPAKSTEG